MVTPDSITRASFEQSALPLAVVDNRGLLALWNRAFEPLFLEIAGSGPERFRGSFFGLIHEREGASFDFYCAELLLGGRNSASIETPVRAADGQRRWLHIRLSLLEPSVLEQGVAATGERFILCSLEDITDRVVRERDLREAKEEAEKATHTKSLFLANMSHEIRTPIQTILGVLELLGETKLDGEQAEYATTVRFSAEVLLALINDILDFSKIEADKLNLETTDFDLPAALYQSVNLLVMDAHRKGLEVVIDPGEAMPAIVRGDPTRLRQIIVNLLKNAIKFTSSGTIFLVMRLLGDSAQPRLRFEIRDTGIGIPDELRERLFTPFFQADFAAARKTGGTGLGLAISRRLVELMGGSIGASANLPQGSVFWFEIPLSVPEYASVSDERLDEGRGHRLLVVDDSPDARAIAAKIASRAGYEVGESASGDEALAALHEAASSGRAFDLCLIDQNMPRMDGWRLASEITGDTAINGARLVLMVPEGTMGGDAKMKLLRWFDAYVSKPVRPALLLDSLAVASSTKVDLDLADPRREEAQEVSLEPSFDAEVLLAEDHEVNRELFTLILSRLGCTVTAARDGMEAVEMGTERLRAGRPFDIVLMDIFMPRMNGYEASGRLRAEGYRGPLVAVTASALKGEREKCIEAGMDDVLVKPFKKRDLARVLRKWLAEARGGERPVPRADSGRTEALPANSAPKVEADRIEPDLASKEIFDWDSVLDTFLGQEATVRNLLARFIDKAKTQLEELDAALETGNLDDFMKISHSLKGAALNLAAGRLGSASKAGEAAGKKGDPEAARAALAEIAAAFSEFSRAVLARKESPAD